MTPEDHADTIRGAFWHGQGLGGHNNYRAAEDALANLLSALTPLPCPDCGIPKEWCRRVSSDTKHCWRWDYERFDELATRSERLIRTLTEMRAVAEQKPLMTDISDYSDEWCAGFLAGQANAIDACVALATD